MISNVEQTRAMLNIELATKCDVQLPELDWEASFLDEGGGNQIASGSRTSSATGRKCALSPTAAWTGLAVSKKHNAVATTRESAINRHGDASSSSSKGKPKRERPEPLRKVDGKYRVMQ